MTPQTQDKLVRRLQRQDSRRRGRASRSTKKTDLEDAEVVVVSYGITSRVAQTRHPRWRAAARHRRSASSA